MAQGGVMWARLNPGTGPWIGYGEPVGDWKVAESSFHGNIEQESWESGRLPSERGNPSLRFRSWSMSLEYGLCAHARAPDPYNTLDWALSGNVALKVKGMSSPIE